MMQQFNKLTDEEKKNLFQLVSAEPPLKDKRYANSKKLSLVDFMEEIISGKSSRVRDARKQVSLMSSLANMAIEELIRQRYELPAFSTLLRIARASRNRINQG